MRTIMRDSFNSVAPYCYMYTTGSDKEPNGAGRNVNIYVIDSGVFCEHEDFTKKDYGTCSWGVDLVDNTFVDSYGHGTHV
jgi:subtilisin family serine protease